MTTIKKIINDNLFYLLFVALLGFTQVTFGISAGFSSNGIIFLNLSELLLIILWLYFLIARIKRGNFQTGNYILSNKVFLSVLIFVIYYILIFLIRLFMHKDLTGSFIILRVIVFPIVIFLMVPIKDLHARKIFLSILAFFTLVNIVQMFQLVVFHIDSRQLPALQNINVYLIISAMILPLEMLSLKNAKITYPNQYKLFRIVIVINIFISCFLMIISGSRLGIYFIVPLFFISYFINFKVCKQNMIKLASGICVFLITVLFVVSTNTFNSAINVARVIPPASAFMLSKAENQIVNSKVQTDSDTVNDSASNHNEVDEYKKAEGSADASNSMRTALWKESIKLIRNNFWLGTGTTDVKTSLVVNGETWTVNQSPHNFILESWLSFGFFGMLLYLILMSIPLMLILSNKKMLIRIRLNYILVYFVTFLFSFVEPLITSFFVVSVMFWTVLSMYYCSCLHNKDGFVDDINCLPNNKTHKFEVK